MKKHDEQILVSLNKIPDDDVKKQNKVLLTILILFMICVLIGVSYAFWTNRLIQNTSNILNSNCLKLTITDESNAISLDNAYPISDNDAETLTPYEFTIKNTCVTSVDYTITLEIMDDEKRLNSEYIAVNFNNKGKKLLNKFRSVTPTYKDKTYTAVEARKLATATLAGNGEETYSIKLWMDQDVTSTDSMDKVFLSKISVIATQEQEKANLLDSISTLAKTDTKNLVSDDGTNDHNIRYIGSNPNNYLCFDEDCTNGYWRVIGLMNNMITSNGESKSLLKIVSAESIGRCAWNSDNTSNWESASLNNYLNSDWYNSYLADYDNLVESVVWNLGGSNSIAMTASEYYSTERGSLTPNDNLYASTWAGKVALIYPSDYGFATNGGDSGRDTCLSYKLGVWDKYSDCYGNDYLFDSTYYRWFLMPNTSSKYALAYSTYSSGVVANGPYVYNEILVYPALYLKQNIQILDGDGSQNNPWVIGFE